MPFAIVDCETTGLFPSAHHRIIELAIIQLDSIDGESRAWSTLINPGRDLGDAEIHGIRGRDVRDAPRFEQVVGTVLSSLEGRVVVAHNARFDRAFLESELARAGYDVAPLPTLCTIELARTLDMANEGARLVDCCRARGIPVEHQHQALSDAHLCEALLRSYLPRAFEEAGGLMFAPVANRRSWPRASDERQAVPRSLARASTTEPGFLGRLAASRSEIPDVGHQSLGYLELLDRVLEDRRLTEREGQDLVAMAELYGLSGSQLQGLHIAYLNSVLETALADGVVSDRESYDLELVGELLGVDGVDLRLEEARFDTRSMTRTNCDPENPELATGREDLGGQTVCFTGKLLCTIGGATLTRERACRLAEEAGMVPQSRVTKSLNVLVVADPETNSGKSRKAREYGTRVVAETRFWKMIGVAVE